MKELPGQWVKLHNRKVSRLQLNEHRRRVFSTPASFLELPSPGDQLPSYDFVVFLVPSRQLLQISLNYNNIHVTCKNITHD
jgi:hypothetical protein